MEEACVHAQRGGGVLRSDVIKDATWYGVVQCGVVWCGVVVCGVVWCGVVWCGVGCGCLVGAELRKSLPELHRDDLAAAPLQPIHDGHARSGLVHVLATRLSEQWGPPTA